MVSFSSSQHFVFTSTVIFNLFFLEVLALWVFPLRSLSVSKSVKVEVKDGAFSFVENSLTGCRQKSELLVI